MKVLAKKKGLWKVGLTLRLRLEPHVHLKIGRGLNAKQQQRQNTTKCDNGDKRHAGSPLQEWRTGAITLKPRGD